MTILSSILSAFGGAAVALIAAGYFARRFMDIQIARTIEKYKAELEQKSNILKTELSIYAHEQNVGLTRIDQQRSQAIQVIFGVIVNWQNIWIEISSPNSPKKLTTDEMLLYYNNHAKSLVNVAEEISKQALNFAIYFSNESFGIIGNFGNAVTKISCDFYNSTFGKLDMSNETFKIPLLNIIEYERKELPKTIMAELNELKNDLIIEFRCLLNADSGDQLPSTTQNETSK